jgi:hypothetical protein
MLYSLLAIYSILSSRGGICCRCYTACWLYTVYHYHEEVYAVDVMQLVSYIQYIIIMGGICCRCYTDCWLYTVYYYHGEVYAVDVIQLVSYMQYIIITGRCML